MNDRMDRDTSVKAEGVASTIPDIDPSIDAIAAELKLKYRVAVILGLVLLAGVVVFAGVVEYLSRGTEFSGTLAPDDTSEFPIDENGTVGKLRNALLIVAFVQFILINFIRKAIIKASVKRSEKPGSVASGKGGQGASADALFKSTIISLGLSDGIAVYGMMLFLLSGAPLDFYIFAFISIFSFVVYFPRYGRWRALSTSGALTL